MTNPGSNQDRVAVIDIGSNSIKMLVAGRNGKGRLMVIDEATDETRIGTGITGTPPRLLDSSMAEATASVLRLKAAAISRGARRFSVTATSAVRDAVNRDEFKDRLMTGTGLDLRILTGLEEAKAIAGGVRLDPGLEGVSDFYLLDLGGGSLELLSIENREIRNLDSLPLGCVRLTETFIPDRNAPFSEEERKKIATHVRESLADSGFSFDLPAGALAVATGGTAAVARSLTTQGPFGSAGGTSTAGLLTRDFLESLLTALAPLPLSERRHFPGLPATRADVYPVALATLLAILEIGKIASLRHSFYNLRFGEAARILNLES